MIVAIHQPNFLPWLGFFDKIARSDLFILLDNVQFPRQNCGTWTNRVQILVGGKPAWLTVPVQRDFHGTRLISEMQIDNTSRWRVRMTKTIEMNYGKRPHFASEWEVVKNLIAYETPSLATFNVNAITHLVDYLGLGTSKLTLGSSLGINGKGTELLIAMVKGVKGTTYMCGGGADGYQDDDLFRQLGLKLEYQGFAHPEYQQKSKAFVSGLSVIDALFNLGREGTTLLLKGENILDKEAKQAWTSTT